MRCRTETEIVRAEVGWSSPRGQIDLGLVHGRRNRGDYALGYLVLQSEDVVQLTLKTIRPEVRTRRGVNQLTSYANCPCCLAHTPFNHVTDAKFTPHLLDIDSLALVGKA
jgi:hypothetical protein